MADTAASPLPKDSRLDRATDPEYAAISTMAVLGLVLAVLGPAVWLVVVVLLGPALGERLAAPLVALPALGVLLGAASLRKIRRSEGVLAGRRLALVGLVVGGAAVLGTGGYHAWRAYDWHATLGGLSDRALAVADDLGSQRYEKVFEQIPQPIRDRHALTLDAFRRRLSPLFEEAGAATGRGLRNLQPYRTQEGGEIALAEVRLDLERRGLLLEVWFLRQDDGTWALVGVGGNETFESAARGDGDRSPVSAPGPYQRSHGHDHDH